MLLSLFSLPCIVVSHVCELVNRLQGDFPAGTVNSGTVAKAGTITAARGGIDKNPPGASLLSHIASKVGVPGIDLVEINSTSLPVGLAGNTSFSEVV